MDMSAKNSVSFVQGDVFRPTKSFQMQNQKYEQRKIFYKEKDKEFYIRFCRIEGLVQS